MYTVINIGGVPEHFNLPWKLANDYGLFKKANVDFNWQFYSAITKLLKAINFTTKQFMTADNSIDMLLEKFDMQPEDALTWFYSTEWNTDFQVSEKNARQCDVFFEKNWKYF